MYRCRPRTRARATKFISQMSWAWLPRARGLTLGYMLSPAYAGSRDKIHIADVVGLATPGLADSRWATCCRPRTQARATKLISQMSWAWLPRAGGLTLGYMLSPAYAGYLLYTIPTEKRHE